MLHYFDDDDETRRNWERIAPTGISRATISGKPLKVRSGGTAIHEGLLVAHRSTLIATVGLDALSRIAAAEKSILFIVVSGKRQREVHSATKNLYYRHWPVGNPIDTGFLRCWQTFTEALLQGKTRFDLLEPSYNPHLSALRILVAAHLSSPIDQRPGCRANEQSAWLIEACEKVMGAAGPGDLISKLASEIPDADAADLVSLLRQNDLAHLTERLKGF